MTNPQDPFRLGRFVEAQDGAFDDALAELRSGAKRSHWMWFVFPQIAGLGHSATSRHFAITGLEEARAFAAHPLLGLRYRQAVEAVLDWSGRRDPAAIFGATDAMKLRSSLTLFAAAMPEEPLFGRALEALYRSPDPATLAILGQSGG